jgi:hypothetical protein
MRTRKETVMTNPHRSANVLAVLALLAAVCLVAPGEARAASCEYHLNIENQADQSIDVQKIKWKRKTVGDWGPWRNIENGPVTLADQDKEEYKQKQDSVACYRFRWKLQWKCSSDSTWHDYDIPPDDPDNDRVSNWFLLIDGCAKDDVARSEDGDFL